MIEELNTICNTNYIATMALSKSIIRDQHPFEVMLVDIKSIINSYPSFKKKRDKIERALLIKDQMGQSR